MKIKYIGREHTMTYVKEGEEKVRIKPNEVFTCEEDIGKELLKHYGSVFVVAPKTRKKRTTKRETQDIKTKETA